MQLEGQVLCAVQHSTGQGVLRLPGAYITASLMCNGLPIRIPIGEGVAVKQTWIRRVFTTHICLPSALSDLAEGGEKLAISLR